MSTGFLWAAFAPAGRAAGTSASNEQVRLGRALFLAGCSSCHGLSAQGGNRGPQPDRCRRSGRRLPGQHRPDAARQTPGGVPASLPEVQPDPDRPAGRLHRVARPRGRPSPTPRRTRERREDRRGRRAVPYQLRLSATRRSVRAAHSPTARTPRGSARPPRSRSPRPCAPGRRTCRSSVTGQLSDQQVASIIKYVQFVSSDPKDPGGASIGHYGPVTGGSGGHRRRARRPGHRHPVDRNETVVSEQSQHPEEPAEGNILDRAEEPGAGRRRALQSPRPAAGSRAATPASSRSVTPTPKTSTAGASAGREFFVAFWFLVSAVSTLAFVVTDLVGNEHRQYYTPLLGTVPGAGPRRPRHRR